MAYPEVPRFPRGFLLSEYPVEAPPTFVPGPILPNFYVHLWTHVETAGAPDLFVIILGHCVPTQAGQDSDVAAYLLRELHCSESSFLRALDHLGGRHAIVFGSVGNIRVVNDATGMRSVFYAAAGGVVASHAVLVERALGGDILQNELPFRYGYPGHFTPYQRTRILTPNTYYWMTARLVRRFWPITEPAPMSVDEAASVLLRASAVGLQAMSHGRSVGLTMTAGLDSRTILAMAMYAGIPFHTYTYGSGAGTLIDRQIGAALADYAGVDHKVVGRYTPPELLAEHLQEAHYSTHHAQWVGPMRQYFKDADALAVLGNCLEIGRSNYGPARRKGVSAPVCAKTMAALHYRKLGPKVQLRVEAYGRDRFQSETAEAFQMFIDQTGYGVVLGKLDPFDQFYWEHRMPTWQGVAMGERDFYAVPLIPFNARVVFNALLGVRFEDRRTDAAVYRMIEMVDPGLLDLPVNPKKLPKKLAR